MTGNISSGIAVGLQFGTQLGAIDTHYLSTVFGLDYIPYWYMQDYATAAQLFCRKYIPG